MLKSTSLTELFESFKTKYKDEKGRKITNEKSKGRSNDYISLLNIYSIIRRTKQSKIVIVIYY